MKPHPYATKVSKNGILKLRLSEVCSDCKLLTFELQKSILNIIKEEVPEVLCIMPISSAFAEAFCEKCHMPLEKCVCVCPYCGKVEDCDCALGYGRATSG